MKKSYHLLFIFFILFTIPHSGNLLAEQIVFKQISLEEGLSQSKVVAICRDFEGYLWAGTEDGINRISQSAIKTYHFDYADSLRGNFIYFIEEDYNKNLWIGTDKGLLFYNRLTDDFEISEHSKYNYTACFSESNQIIFKAYDHLLILSEKGSQYIKFENNRLYNQSCRIVRKDDTHLILTGYWQGIYELNIETGFLRGLPLKGVSAYTSVTKDQQGRYWVGFYGGGVKCLDSDLNILKEFSFDELPSSNHNLVMDIAVDKNNQIWVVTDGGGLKCIDPITFTIKRFIHDQGVKNSIPVNSLLNIYIDKNSFIWIGSVSGGLIGIDTPLIKSFQEAVRNTNMGLSHSNVNCFVKSESTIWIGTDGNGINAYNHKNDQFTHFPNTFNQTITSLIDWDQERLIAVIYNKGIYFFNKKTGELQLIDALEALNHNIRHTQVSPGIYRLDDESIFIASTHCYYHNFKKNETIDISKNLSFKHFPSLRLAGKTDKSLFLYDSNKIVSYDLKNKKIRMIAQFSSSKIGNILSMAYLKDGSFWICTRTGLFCFNSNNNRLERHKLPGFANPSLIVALSDDHLGIGTKLKFVNYNPKQRAISFYDTSNGLLVNEYSRRGFLIDPEDSLIYAGGVNGLSIIPAASKPDSASYSNNIILTGIWVNGEKTTFHPLDNTKKCLKLPAGISKLEFHLNNRGANLFKTPIFRYRLVGYSNGFKNSSDYILDFYNLDPGNYKLEIQYQLENGHWSQYNSLVEVNIAPYWWDSSLFRISLSFLILCLIAGIIYKIKKDEVHKVEEKIRAYEKDMYQKKIQFFESINHELRTPLTLIAGPVKRLLNKPGTLNHEAIDTLQKISNQTDYMKNVINMVLDIRKQDLGVTEMNYKSTNLIRFIKEIQDEFKEAYEQKNVQLRFESSLKEVNLYIDQLKVKIILVNLLNNALKFSDPFGNVTMRLTRNEGFIDIYVTDEGIGLKDSDLENLFSSFYQGKHDKEGNGIGLYYSRMLIHLMGGEISAKNNETKGATFTVRFPSDSHQKMVLDEHNESTQYSINKKYQIGEIIDPESYSLLLVEDIPEMRSYLSDELRSVFPHVYCAANGKEAHDILKKQAINLVISDIMMPVMDGYELCSLIKQDIELSHIPVILLTALCEEHNIKTGYGCGANTYLAKPFDTQSLIQLIQTLIHQQEMLKVRFKEASFAIVPEELAHSNLDKVFIDKLIQIINTHIEQPELDVDFICDKMAVSRSTLYSKMKSYIGKGCKELINDIRIEKAKTMLRKTDLPISEISEKVGFSQQRYFSRVFKSEVGMTPSEFRTEKK